MPTCTASVTGQRLADGDDVAHLLLVEPAALLDQVSLHQATERDRTAEPCRAEPEELAGKLNETGSGLERRGLGHAASISPPLSGISRTAYSGGGCCRRRGAGSDGVAGSH